MTERLDPRQLRALLAAYLRMSVRGRTGQAFAGGSAGGPRGLFVLLAMYVVLGCGAALLVTARLDVFAYALALHTLTFGLLGMTVTAESGDLLFNPAERDVLGARPVGTRTLMAAKATNLAAFTLLLALALNLPGMALGAVLPTARAGFALAHFLAVALNTIFVTASVVVGYGLAARLVGRERLETVAAWSQVVLGVAFLSVSQGLTRLAGVLQEVHLVGLPWVLWCLPPTWFAALSVAAGGRTPPGASLVLAALAVVATGALVAAALGRLVLPVDEGRAPAARVRGQPGAVAERLAGWWLRDPVERAAFRLAAIYLRRDRELKTRLYPSLVAFALLPLLGLGGGERAEGFAALVSVTMVGMLPGVALEALRASAHHAAADVFVAAPLAGPGPLFHGVRKATVCFLLVPGVAAALGLAALTAPRGLALTLPGLVALPTFSLLPGLFGDYVPLSQPPMQGRQSAANVALMVVSTLALALVLAAVLIAWRMGALATLVAGEAALVAVLHPALARWIDRRPFRRAA